MAESYFFGPHTDITGLGHHGFMQSCSYNNMGYDRNNFKPVWAKLSCSVSTLTHCIMHLPGYGIFVQGL